MTLNKQYMNFYLVMGIILAFFVFMIVTTAFIIHDVNQNAIRDIPTVQNK